MPFREGATIPLPTVLGVRLMSNLFATREFIAGLVIHIVQLA